MTQDAEYYYWSKGENDMLSPHFNLSEYTCHCAHTSCVQQKIAKDLVSRNEEVRSALGMPLTISSGYRCQAHQDDLKAQGFETATGVSQHTLGNASDLAASDMNALYKICFNLFDAIGRAHSFIHVDLRGKHLDGSKRVWGYLKS